MIKKWWTLTSKLGKFNNGHIEINNKNNQILIIVIKYNKMNQKIINKFKIN